MKLVPSHLFPAVPTLPTRLRAGVDAGPDYGATDPPDWRATDWRKHLHTIEIDGRPVNYVDIGDAGDSRPIVFVHGLSGQWQNWLETIPRFAQRRRIVAPDLPGFGASPLPRERISIELYGRLIVELCERLELAPAVLVGSSMGGFVSAEVAIRRPEIVERLMLVSAAGVSQADLAARPLLAGSKAIGLVITSALSQLRPAARRPRVRHWFLSIVVRHPSRLRADLALEGLINGADPPGFEDGLRANLVYDFRERLPQIGCPTLVVWGEQDMIIPVRDADRFLELIPGSRKLVLEDTGHLPMVERPPTFNAELARFLEPEAAAGEVEDEPAGSGDRTSP